MLLAGWPCKVVWTSYSAVVPVYNADLKGPLRTADLWLLHGLHVTKAADAWNLAFVQSIVCGQQKVVM